MLHFLLYAAIPNFVASEGLCHVLSGFQCSVLDTLREVSLCVVLVLLCVGDDHWAPLVSHLDEFF